MAVEEAGQGYAEPGYAASLAEFGQPAELPHSRGWLLARPIGATGLVDAMGSYPLFNCADWSGLADDLEGCADRFVSVALVTDPFGAYEEALLRASFHRVLAFKQHFVADLTQPFEASTSANHRRNARAALRRLTVDVPANREACLDDWCALYERLAAERRIVGIRRFSRPSFAAQFRLPGLVVLRAREAGVTVGMHLWLLDGQAAHSHLSAQSARGYELCAGYALHWLAREHFAGKVRWLHLGAGPGVTAQADDGVSSFKRGWATGTRPAYFCGRICAPERYRELVRASGNSNTSYFPAYRFGEF